MSTTESPAYDLVVIGGGPGGYVAAIRASQLGLRTAVVEKDALGGICLNWGCIPSKSLLRNAEILSLFARAKDFGISADNVKGDYAAAIDRCLSIVDTQVKGVNFLMRKNKIDVVRGTGKIASKTEVYVSGGADGERSLATKAIIIATGSRVKTLNGVHIDGQKVISAKEIWSVKTLPKSVVIVGGGPIGVEFATAHHAYGCDTTIVEFVSRLLPLEDEEMSSGLAKAFTSRGIRLQLSTAVSNVDTSGKKVQVHVAPAPGATHAPSVIETDRVIVATGFTPNSEDLGLEGLGIQVDHGFIQIDDRMQTSVQGIFAIGDVTGKLNLAHVASAQGEIAAEVIAGHATIKPDYDSMPKCTYSAPQVASMGLTELQAREGGREIKVGKFPFKPNGKAMALGETEGQVKIIGDAKTGEILGAHMIGADVTELIGEFSLARTLESTSFEIARSVHPHPTLSEVIAEAAMNVEGKAIHM